MSKLDWSGRNEENKKADEPVTGELGCGFALHLRFDFFVRPVSWIL
jgi:hypothetical protein